jgi:hypothetical protein
VISLVFGESTARRSMTATCSLTARALKAERLATARSFFGRSWW